MDKDIYVSGRYVSHFQPDSEKNAFNKIYAEKKEYILSQIKGRDSHILDIGGGMGRISIPLSKSHRVVLADLSMAMLHLAGQNGSGFGRVNCSADALSFKEKSFDIVIAIDLVPHLSNAEEVFDRFRRLLKPGGQLIIDATNSNPLWILAYPGYVDCFKQPMRWLQTFRGKGILPEWQTRIQHLRRRRFEKMLERSGFRVDRWKMFGPRWCPKWFLAVCTIQ